MSLDSLLQQLEQVRQIRADQYVARCPAHDDRNPSLNIKLAEDGTVLVRCFAGCSAQEVVESVGLCMADLFPNDSLSNQDRQSLKMEHVRKAYSHEKTVLLIARADLKRGQPLSDTDRARVNLALRRLRQFARLLREEVT